MTTIEIIRDVLIVLLLLAIGGHLRDIADALRRLALREDQRDAALAAELERLDRHAHGTER